MPFTFPSLQNPYNPGAGGQDQSQGPGAPTSRPQGPAPARPGVGYGWTPGTQMGTAPAGSFNMPGYLNPSNWSLPSMFTGEGLWGTVGGLAGLMYGGPLGMQVGRYAGRQAAGLFGDDQGAQQPSNPWYQGPSASQAVVDANQPGSGEYSPQPLSGGVPGNRIDESGRYALQDDGTLVDLQTGAEYARDSNGDWRLKTSMGTYRGNSGFVTGVMGNIPQMNPVAPNDEQANEITRRMGRQVR